VASKHAIPDKTIDQNTRGVLSRCKGRALRWNGFLMDRRKLSLASKPANHEYRLDPVPSGNLQCDETLASTGHRTDMVMRRVSSLSHEMRRNNTHGFVIPQPVYVCDGSAFLLINKEPTLLQLRNPRSMLQIRYARSLSKGEIDGNPKRAQVYSGQIRLR
jgi:hypothetical protein